MLNNERYPDIPDSIYQKAKEKETLQWLYENAARYEEKYNLPKGILLPLAGHESANYQKAIKSGTGPRGLFQISKYIARQYGLRVNDEIDDRLDLDKSTDAAARLLAERLKSNNGDVAKSLAQYNGGIAAADWIDGRTHLYDPNNGNPGELYGFMRGVANYAKEWGNEDLFNTLRPTYNNRREEIIQMKQKMKAAGYDVSVDGSWGSQSKKLWAKYQAENPEPAPVQTQGQPYKPNEGLKVVSVQPPQMPKKMEAPSKTSSYVSRNQPTVTNTKTKEPLLGDENNPMATFSGAQGSDNTPQRTNTSPKAKTPEKPAKRDPREIRVYKMGGVLSQKAEGSKDLPLQGEERVYSIKDTKSLVEKALAAKTEADLINLGKFFYKATKKQDERDPEYTKD